MNQELTLKQEKFVHNYVKTGNATQSAIKAGYSPKTAYSIGSENLSKPEIENAIEAKTAKILNPEEIKQKITEKVNSNNEAIVLKACELLGRTYGMYIDKNINENHNYNESELDKMREQAIQEAIDSIKTEVIGNK